ncbi:unnamed protein product [Nezara viridula]|uniref:Thiamin pyrophosphokinase catalytic domain-containing protein n=1 Tax=Nezara viridula TaxID=85310 RepID=A0A9P0MSR3_NEZVI|nr:unnamed protein product [Nezara viridula]
MLRFIRKTFDHSQNLLNTTNRSIVSTVPNKEVKEWKIFSQPNKLPLNFGTYGILVLNRPILVSPNIVSSLWDGASCRITVDGGTNRWFHFCEQHCLDLPLPTCVTGDLDSIHSEILNFCKKQNEVSILHTPKQDCNDFDKALNVLLEICPVKVSNQLIKLVNFD